MGDKTESSSLLDQEGNTSSNHFEKMSLQQLVENQRSFFRSGEPAQLTHRRVQLLKLRKALIEHKDILAGAIEKDLQRRADLSYLYEIAPVIVEIDYVLDNLEEWSSSRRVQKTFLTMLDTPEVVLEPKGVVLIIGPWNYPLNVVLTPLVTVLAAGNTAVIKPSEISSNTAEALNTVFSKTFDPRFVSVVLGDVEVTSELLKQRFDHIVFTGSTATGKIIMKAAADNLTPCTLELGGKCPVIVEADADLSITCRRLAWGKWLNCGQTCLAPDYILCTAETKRRLVGELIRVVETFYSKDIKSNQDYSRIINAAHYDRLMRLLDDSSNSDNEKILFKGAECDKSNLFIPPVIMDATPDDKIMKEEIFGPLLPIVTINSFNEALEFISRGEKPLGAYLFTRDEQKVEQFLKKTSSGSVAINDVILQITVDTLPFGGVGNSGMGRYHGKFGFDEFSHEKAVLKRGFFGDGIAAARYPPLTAEKIAKLHQLTSVRRAFPKTIARVFAFVPLFIVGVVIGVIGQRYLF